MVSRIAAARNEEKEQRRRVAEALRLGNYLQQNASVPLPAFSAQWCVALRRKQQMDLTQWARDQGTADRSLQQHALGYRDRIDAAKRTAGALADAARIASYAAAAAATAAYRALATDVLAHRVRAEQEVHARVLRMKGMRHAAAMQREERLNAQESAGFAVDLDDDEYVA